MNKAILDYLNAINTTNTVNKLIVSAFLKHKQITSVKNIKISSLIFRETDIDYTVYKEFEFILSQTNQFLCFEELLELFEFVISPSEKIINGAIYTPRNIRNYITKEIFSQFEKRTCSNIKVADIACGCGGFLIDASKKLKKYTKKSYKEIFENNIYGIDIQSYSCERTMILLSLLAIVEGEDEEHFNFNIFQGNSLKYDWGNTKFDIILGNPPYVCSRNMDDVTKNLIAKWSSCSSGHPDLYIPFFQIGFELLSKNGVLGYITVNSFLNSINGRAIRQYFTEKKSLLKIIDFKDEQIFKDRLTYTCICFIEKIESEIIYYKELKESELIPLKKINFNQNKYMSLNSRKGWNLKDRKFIEKIESIGIPFENIYETKSGIATLKNNVYIFLPQREDKRYYYINDNAPIEKDICKDVINSNKLKNYNSIEPLIEKMIFPYIYNENGQAVLIDEKKMKNIYPFAYSYLLAKKDVLATRDKGKGKYPVWYAFGRTQSLEKRKEKLFFPNMAKKGFNAILNNDENLYFYNGMVAYGNRDDLQILKKILQSDIFWKYIEYSAKPYTSGYFGIGKNTLKNFGIYQFNEREKTQLLSLKHQEEVNVFLNDYYKLN